jgi:hypothetical protein
MFRGSPLFAPAWELAGLALLLVVYLLADMIFGPESSGVLNIVGPMWLTAVLCLGVLRMLLLDGAAVWTALFWFRVSVFVYFGLGALVPLLASAGTKAYLEASYQFFDDEMEKINLVVVVACVTVLISANMYLAVRKAGSSERRMGVSQNNESDTKLLTAGLFFLVLGAPVKYLFTVPQMFGMTDFILPGGLGAIGNFTYGAVFFLTAWSYESSKGAFPLVILFVGLELLIGVLALTKTEVLTVLIMFLLAFIRRQSTLPRMFVITATMLLCFMSVQPIIDAGRAELQRRHPDSIGADLAERLEILSSSIGSSGSIDDGSDVSSLLVRISYMNAAVFAVRQYDGGQPGNSMSMLSSVFVPRFLWPDKPIITQVAVDFNYAATGISTSASSPGLFAEAYWDFGWAGVVLLMVTLGIVLAPLSQYTLSIFHGGKWLYFPVMIMGMRIGFRTDGFYVTDVVGGVVILVCLHISLKIFERFVLPMFPRLRSARS